MTKKTALFLSMKTLFIALLFLLIVQCKTNTKNNCPNQQDSISNLDTIKKNKSEPNNISIEKKTNLNDGRPLFIQEKNKKIKVLWQENDELKYNTEYLQNCSKQEKAIMGFLSLLHNSNHYNQEYHLEYNLNSLVGFNIVGGDEMGSYIMHLFKNDSLVDKEINNGGLYPYHIPSDGGSYISIYKNLNILIKDSIIEAKFDCDQFNVRTEKRALYKDKKSFMIQDSLITLL